MIATPLVTFEAACWRRASTAPRKSPPASDNGVLTLTHGCAAEVYDEARQRPARTDADIVSRPAGIEHAQGFGKTVIASSRCRLVPCHGSESHARTACTSQTAANFAGKTSANT